MITITEATKSIVMADPLALQAVAIGVLNLSSYAARIHTQVEAMTFKEVKKGSIVVALTRIAAEIEGQPSLQPDVLLNTLSFKTGLCSLTFFRTPELQKKATQLRQNIELPDTAFFTYTQSTSQITLIMPESVLDETLEYFAVSPIAVFQNQVGVSVQFSESYLQVPNVLYTLLSSLAVQHINLTEIVSTYTELCFIVAKSDLDAVSTVLKKYMQ